MAQATLTPLLQYLTIYLNVAITKKTYINFKKQNKQTSTDQQQIRKWN